LSPLRDWLAQPAARARLQPVIAAMQRQFFGAAAEPPTEGTTAEPPTEAVESANMTESFIADMPIAKLVMFGALSEQDLARLIEEIN